ncbi:hypothetical protein [Streptosporangium sp. V21-05]|uniref:hypothetical protein n=1 Tax=Streptosporangium sp. V21-05 TaxID=3446115 RepID=UPI003F53DD67
MNGIINIGPGVLRIAPPGTDPDELASWQVIGATAGCNLTLRAAASTSWPNQPAIGATTVCDLVLDEPDPPLMVWPPTPRTIIFAARLTWCGHLVLFRRTSPHARRVKTAYHQRSRRRRA